MTFNQILVCQFGARHRYAIPRMLDNGGRLAAFYTDSSSASMLGRVAGLLGRIASSRAERLANRRIFGVRSEKIFSTDYVFWSMLGRSLHNKDLSPFAASLVEHHILSRKMIGWGTRNARFVYSMGFENIEFVESCKAKGLKSIVDAVSNPELGLIIEKEEKSFSEWGGGAAAHWRDYERLYKKSLGMADLILCPSQWVAEGVQRVLGAGFEEKVSIVPYGSSLEYGNKKNVPTLGRIFFAGSQALIKGLHYLGAAASSVKKQHGNLQVRVAGIFPKQVTGHELCRDVTFLGRLSTEEMKEEYLVADFFVLPSLCEGFAGVAAEAVCAGCPVIVTREAGSPVENEREGLIVAAGDAAALAAAIERMLKDRSFRDACAANCFARRSYYSEQEWQKRLISALP